MADSPPSVQKILLNGKDWHNLTPAQRIAAVVGALMRVALAALNLALMIGAYRDLYRRPPEQVWGKKWLWIPVIGINPGGPLVYFFLGRKPAPAEEAQPAAFSERSPEDAPISLN